MAATCREPDCGRPVVAKGRCATHYQRMRRGSADGPVRPRNDAEPMAVEVHLRLPRALADALGETGASSLAAAVRLVLEGWRIRRERGIE